MTQGAAKSGGDAPVPIAKKDHSPAIHSRKDLSKLALGALGVVYGDIGTSPLYAVKECFNPHFGLVPNEANVLGITSLIFWSLMLVVVIKYLTFVMRADNRGEGGILALLSLVAPTGGASRTIHGRSILIMLGLIGAALLAADGMITPAITVLSAVEGLEIATPLFMPFVIPITVGILISVFMIQKRGTEKIGYIFGPMMLLWFTTLAVMAVPAIINEPHILLALSPTYAAQFFMENGWHGFIMLSSVVLVITGGEALYTDMGHFGKQPIRWAWYGVVFPSLVLNYLGQGAAILTIGATAAQNPFYALASGWAVYPLIALATCAAVIASQALISGAYSLGQQAVQLGYSPRLTIIHTSGDARGQIYIPEVNTALMIACVALVIAFEKSSNLAAAYGIAVVGTMTMTSILMYFVAIRKWKWTPARAFALTALFLTIDFAFLAANATKITHGGWFTLAVGFFLFTIMTTWKRGRAALFSKMRQDFFPVERFMQQLKEHTPVRVPGTAVFMTPNLFVTPPAMMHHYKHNKILHHQVIMLSVVTEGVPIISGAERLVVKDLGLNIYQVIARYGFMQTPAIADIVQRCAEKKLTFDRNETTYFLGRETLLTTGPNKMMRWRKSLFAFLTRNSRPATAYFGIPADRVVELGMQVEL